MSLTYLWGRRVSDEQITIESGLLNKLLPGDIVLADGGFNIGDSVGFYCASLDTYIHQGEKTGVSV